ncbi:MAG: hypothetical protein RIS80_1203, partial [Actinomycetota bacterium]
FRPRAQTSATSVALPTQLTPSFNHWIPHLHSSSHQHAKSPYTTEPIPGKKRTWVRSTAVISIFAIVGGVGVDLWLNAGSLLGGSSATASGNTDMTVTGDAIQYPYGVIQVEVVRSGGKITDITLLQAGATGGRSAAFSYLIDYAMQAQGSNFGNISGATYTTAAFVQSLDSALAQF